MDISKKLFTFLSYLIVLIPLTLITGPFLPDLIVILLGLYYLLFCYKNNKFYEFNNLFFKFFIIFCLYSTLVSLSSLNVFSLKSSFFIGDSKTDFMAAKKVGVKFYYKDKVSLLNQFKKILNR